jgi:hypothetical protein
VAFGISGRLRPDELARMARREALNSLCGSMAVDDQIVRLFAALTTLPVAHHVM